MPYHGDTMITGKSYTLLKTYRDEFSPCDLDIFIGGYTFQDEEDESNESPLENGITQILKGSSMWFPIVVVDRGYDVLPKNVKKDRISNDNFSY